MQKEPVLILLAGLAGVIDLGLGALVLLKVIELDGIQIASVVAFVTGVCTLAAAVIRSIVFSPATAKKLTDG